MIYVDLEPVFQAERDWDRALQKLSDGVRRGVEKAVKEGAAEAKATHKYQDQTGYLTSRIVGYIETSAPGGATGVIAALADYASFVEGGTSPHPIHARNAPYLVFKGRDGTWVRTKMVNHPGHPAFPFMGPALQKAERVLVRELEVGIAEMQRALDA